MKPRLYNPLDYSSLSDSLARELMSADLLRNFTGMVYTLFFIAAISRHMLSCQTLTSTVRGHFPFI